MMEAVNTGGYRMRYYGITCKGAGSKQEERLMVGDQQMLMLESDGISHIRHS